MSNSTRTYDAISYPEAGSNQPAVISLTHQPDREMLMEPPIGPSSVADARNYRPARSLSCPWTFFHMGLEILLTFPPICFLIYAFLVFQSDGKRVDDDPIPALQNAAKYGPTIFPIAFAAIMGTCLRNVAAWKLERGITVLSLEHLLGSRTVFSAITTPLSLRTVNILTLCLIFLWVLSPIGGQATFRLIDIIPATVHSTENLSYLEVMSAFPHTGPSSSAGKELLPQFWEHSILLYPARQR